MNPADCLTLHPILHRLHTTQMDSSIACNESRLIPLKKCSFRTFAQLFRSLPVNAAIRDSASHETIKKKQTNTHFKIELFCQYRSSMNSEKQIPKTSITKIDTIHF